MQSAMDFSGVLRSMAAKAVEQRETLRRSVRDLTLGALSSRGATTEQLDKILQAITTGITDGATAPGVDAAQIFKDALAGMDDAVKNVVEANQIAWQRLAGESGASDQSQFKKALDEIESMEAQFIKAVQQGAQAAEAQIKAAWGPVLQQFSAAGSQTGAQARMFMETYQRNLSDQLQASSETAFKAAQTLTQNYTAVVSGVLMAMAEAYQEKGKTRR
jgi:hypothetical protein